MSSRPELRLDWCSHEAAKYAVVKWHYSKAMPKGKLVKIGVWENERFIGAVLYGLGATPMLCRPYRLEMNEVVELVRVALAHHETPVSKILAISLRMLRRICPSLRVVVSFADKNEGHHGGIYQATNWIYTGESGEAKFGVISGKVVHPRQISRMKKRDPSSLSKMSYTLKQGKHRYLMPLDDEMRRRIEPLRRSYPKRAGSAVSGTSPDQGGRGGATPTPALSSEEAPNGQARPAQRADDPEDRQGQPRQKAAEPQRTKAAKR
jgi:hypothetical protein